MFYTKKLTLLDKIKLKVISKIQKLLLRLDENIDIAITDGALFNLYYSLAHKHFKIYFGKSLEQEILHNSEIGYMAAKRHSRLVIATLYKDSSDMRKKMIRAAARGTFVKNILLNTEL